MPSARCGLAQATGAAITDESPAIPPPPYGVSMISDGDLHPAAASAASVSAAPSTARELAIVCDIELLPL